MMLRVDSGADLGGNGLLQVSIWSENEMYSVLSKHYLSFGKIWMQIGIAIQQFEVTRTETSLNLFEGSEVLGSKFSGCEVCVFRVLVFVTPSDLDRMCYGNSELSDTE